MHIAAMARNLKLKVRHDTDPVVRALSRMSAHVWPPTPGSRRWLVHTELKYGDPISRIPIHAVSDQDPRTATAKKKAQCGGDRMSSRYHGYAPMYAQYLAPFIRANKEVTLAEVGILQGTGLAIWSELFPRSRLLGLDIDLVNARRNLDALRAKGAFRHADPELHQFDQFLDNTTYLESILQSNKLNIVIDDGVHLDEAILATLASAAPHLAESFVYFIEDNDHVYPSVKAQYPSWNVESFGEMTVITP